MSSTTILSTPPVTEVKEHLGLLVEFESADQLCLAAAKVRDAGYTAWDCHTPYPVHGLDDAMGIKPTILPWISFGGGITGCTLGLVLTSYTNGWALPFSLMQSDNVIIRDLLSPFLPSGYPYVVSGKPIGIYSVTAFIPVMFELTILLAAIGAFLAVWGLSRMPRYHHPVFTSNRFRRASSDRYFISIEAADPQYDKVGTRLMLEGLGGTHIEELEG